MEKRTKRIEFLVNREEYAKLISMNDKRRLGAFIRETLLSNRGGVRRVVVKKIDPRLLYELNRIGNNLNQIARVINTKKNDIGVLQVLSELVVIEEMLKELLDHVK